MDIKGREFISSCDSRYTNPKFRIGLEFMSNLSIAKDVLDDIYPKNFYGYWWKLNNEKFIELENLFNEVDKTNELENNMKNSFFAFEFFDKYISDYYRNWRKK